MLLKSLVSIFILGLLPAMASAQDAVQTPSAKPLLARFNKCATDTTVAWDVGYIDGELNDSIMKLCSSPIADLEAFDSTLEIFDIATLAQNFRTADKTAKLYYDLLPGRAFRIFTSAQLAAKYGTGNVVHQTQIAERIARAGKIVGY